MQIFSFLCLNCPEMNFILLKINVVFFFNTSFITIQVIPSTLGWVWHDYHFTTPHPTPPPDPPRNSTSTRKNDPRGLKFYMRPYLPILTTTKHNFTPPPSPRGLTLSHYFLTKNIFWQLRTTWHNFNPTIFWGGGVIPPPMAKTIPFFSDNFFLDN